MGLVERVAVFIDYRNTYGWARRAFHKDTDPGWCGHVRPLALAQLLTSKGSVPRELVRVGIYVGRPDPRRDPRTYSAHMRQFESWEKDCGPELLLPRWRPLRYPQGWPTSGEAQEKGIDVQLAIDAMVMGVAGQYDTAILATADTDLLPVVEGLQALKAQCGSPGVEVIGWGGPSAKLVAPGLVVRWIGPLDYKAVQDTTDYNIKPVRS